MKTKITISPEMREFNEAVESCDVLTDFQFDRESAEKLLIQIKALDWPREHAKWLANAIAGIAVKR